MLVLWNLNQDRAIKIQEILQMSKRRSSLKAMLLGLSKKGCSKSQQLHAQLLHPKKMPSLLQRKMLPRKKKM